MKYEVSILKTDEGYAVWVPSLKGCNSQGSTEEEALENIKDAIQVYLDVKKDVTSAESRIVEVG